MDRSVDALYVYLDDYIKPGGVAKNYPCDPIKVGGMINLNFDENGVLIGIEILGASTKVPQRLLAQADLIENERIWRSSMENGIS